jgi:hypothetical protein
MQVRSGQRRNNYEAPFENDLFGKMLEIVGMESKEFGQVIEV